MNAPLPTITSPALRYHGSKFRLAQWVMQFFPAHQTYTEAFGGGAGVLLQKPRAYAEVYNDLDGEIVSFFRVLRDPDLRARLIEQITLTPYARAEFELSWVRCADPVEQARRTAVRAFMGFGSGGATKSSTGFRIDTKRLNSTAQHVWARYPQTIAIAGQRLCGVLIENRPAIEVLQQHDGDDALHFVDPPYVFGTRQLRGSNGCYRHEMTDADHGALLEVLRTLRGYVVLSGYPSPLYEEALTDWTRCSTHARASAHRGTARRTECVWINPKALQALSTHPAGLFA